MHVGLLIYGDLNTVSGGYLYNRRLVAALQQAGDRVTVVTQPWRGYAAHLADNLSPRWQQVLQALTVDVLLQDELNHPSWAWRNAMLRRHVRYPIVSLIHLLHSSVQPSWARWFYRAVETRYLRSVDGLLYNSRHTQHLTERYCQPHPLPPSALAPPGRDHIQPLTAAEIERKGYQHALPRWLFLGNVAARKGLHTVLAALRLANEPCELAIVGRLDVDTAYVRHCQRLAAQLPAGCRVVWHGTLLGEALEQQLRWAHALVLPSVAEAYGIAFVEAQAYGLPAIGCLASGATEIIADGYTGYCVAAGDSTAVARHLQHWASNRTQLQQFGRNAYTHFFNQPTWQASCAIVRDFLRQNAIKAS